MYSFYFLLQGILSPSILTYFQTIMASETRKFYWKTQKIDMMANQWKHNLTNLVVHWYVIETSFLGDVRTVKNLVQGKVLYIWVLFFKNNLFWNRAPVKGSVYGSNASECIFNVKNYQIPYFPRELNYIIFKTVHVFLKNFSFR